ncbi:unnamed protein product [Lymnaea stagnalis]|uniref:Uncharacterized protein n=1 Tax=Lymnaea stagnalis TaxID=6523 RepID=A0AAV2IK41_LYMST
MACTFHKVCVPNSSTGGVLKRYVSTLISTKWTEYPRGNKIQFQVIFHPESRPLGTLAYNAITVRGKLNPACGENVLASMMDINMNFSRNIFTSSFRMWPAVASHSNSFSKKKSVSDLLPGRLTSFSAGQNAMLTPVTSHLIAHPARSIRMKHTKPKVPPSRMNNVYDIEGAITDEEAAKQFVYALNTNERKHLYAELARFHGAPDPSVAGE